jgi:hypothetical protein
MRMLRMFAGADIDRVHWVAAWRSMDRETAFGSPLARKSDQPTHW